MKKRILSMLITLVMILGLIPATALTVLGEENTVIVSLVLRPVDAEGNAIDATPQGLGTLDVFVNDSFWVDSQYDGDDDVHTLFVGENVLDDWDFCPLGYAKPDFDITLTADAEGNLTVTSGNATLVKEDDINYIVVVLAEYVCEHTFENGAYCSEGDYHYQQCDNCNYYDPESAEEHYEGVLVDHRCEACNGYVRAWCTPADAETDHFCSNGEVINILVEKKGYSVKQNAEALLTAHKDDAVLVQLVTDLLTYGAAAQNYKDYNNGDPSDLANAGVENLGTPSVALPTHAENVKKLTTHVEALGNVYFTSATVWFDNVNKISVKLSTTENVTLKVNGEAVELSGTAYYTDAIYATGFDTVYIFELYEGDMLVQTLTYSVSAYVYAMMDKTEGGRLTEMAELARALYRYGVSAIAYQNAQVSNS